MKSGTRFICSMFVMASAMAVIWGQQPPGPGRGGFGGPFGGPGGMQQSLVMLLGAMEVRTEIGIRDDQQKEIDELINEVQDEQRASFDLRAAFEMSEEQRQAQFENARKKMEATVEKGEQRVAKILDAQQLERLNQLRLQREGLEAFGRSEVVKRLGLTDQQLAKIGDLQQQSLPQFGFGPPDFDKLQTQQTPGTREGSYSALGRAKNEMGCHDGQGIHFPAAAVRSWSTRFRTGWTRWTGWTWIRAGRTRIRTRWTDGRSGTTAGGKVRSR